MEGQARLPDTSDYGQTPELARITQEEGDSREEYIEQFYDIAYRMGITRCRHHAAANDTAVFQLTIRGYNYIGVAAGLGCTENLAVQHVTYARRRLAAFIEKHGIEVVASWYTEVVAQSRLIDVRAQQVCVAEYGIVPEARFQQVYSVAPKRRLRENWKIAARTLHGTLIRECRTPYMLVWYWARLSNAVPRRP